MDYSIVILAGGKSSRMGKDKSMIKLNGKTILERVVDVANGLTGKVMVVSNEHGKHHYMNVELVSDIRKGLGPLAGIEAALLKTSTEVNVVIACDMPFVTEEMIRQLIAEVDASHDAIIPIVNNQHHPLFAVYKKSTLYALQETLDNGDRKISLFLDKVNTKWISDVFENENCFYNMNTPEDLAFVKISLGMEEV